MYLGFWEKLKKPIIVLAPMADVTDPAFRRIIAKYSKPEGPDVFWTEFVSADGLVRAPEAGKQKLMRDLMYTEAERPIVAQFFTSNPEHMERVASLALELGFDGVDINMGCPDKSIEKQGAGAALMKTPELAYGLVLAAKRGAKKGKKEIPVSVKTRTGFNKDEIDTWIPKLLSAEPAAIIIHARTRKEMSKVPARWPDIKRAVEIRDRLGSKTLILGNGDIKDVPDALEKVKQSGADGAMLGRAIFGNPFLFQNLEKNRNKNVPSGIEGLDISVEQKLKVAIEHTKLFEDLLGDIKSFAIMKKHFKAYVQGFDGAVELREKLMSTNNAKEVEDLILEFLRNSHK